MSSSPTHGRYRRESVVHCCRMIGWSDGGEDPVLETAIATNDSPGTTSQYLERAGSHGLRRGLTMKSGWPRQSLSWRLNFRDVPASQFSSSACRCRRLRRPWSSSVGGSPCRAHGAPWRSRPPTVGLGQGHDCTSEGWLTSATGSQSKGCGLRRRQVGTNNAGSTSTISHLRTLWAEPDCRTSFRRKHLPGLRLTYADGSMVLSIQGAGT